MLDYSTTRGQHLAEARARMGVLHQHAYSPEQPVAFAAYKLCIHWLADYARQHPQWAQQLKQVVKKPVVDWIVARLGVSGVERILVGLFVGVLLDVAFQAFIDFELGSQTPGRQMLTGSMVDTFVRWVSE
jgi:membrane protein required for beta-lactamase induction